MVSHGNLINNLEMIRAALGSTRLSTHVGWVPLHHDMGLILNALHALYVGARCVLMSPSSFIRCPLSWLRAISDYRGVVSGAPNFAFDLCVSRFRQEHANGIDLSCWKVAYNAAEPIRAETLERFATTFAACGFDRAALAPLYELADATVMVSASPLGRGPVTKTVSRQALKHHRIAAPAGEYDRSVLAGSGSAMQGQRIAVIDPETRSALPANRIGEIWVNGANVAAGYWHNPATTNEIFHSTIRREDGVPWLRTGDLGFLDERAELCVTGRSKDIIIIRGINHYPQDIERTVQNSHPALHRDGGAAFAVCRDGGTDMLVVVHEIERTQRGRLEVHDVLGSIREAVVNEHGVAPSHVVLVRPGALPKTASGKVQRYMTRLMWQQGQLDQQSFKRRKMPYADRIRCRQ